jgi:hypothetical protein
MRYHEGPGEPQVPGSHYMLERPNPPPGWYPDPLGTASLRAWDGTRWTTQTRRAGDVVSADALSAHQFERQPPSEPTAVATLPRAPEADISREGDVPPYAGGNLDSTARSPQRRRSRDGSNAIIVILLLLFALSGVYEVVTGSSSGNNDPTRFATPTAAVPTGVGAASPPGPATTANQPSAPAPQCAGLYAIGIVVQLQLEKFPVATLQATPSTKPHNPGDPTAGVLSPCTTEAFTDRRGIGVSSVTVYMNPSAATHVVNAMNPDEHAIAIGAVVLTLNPSLNTFRSSYETAIQVIVLRATDAATNATSRPPTAATLSKP